MRPIAPPLPAAARAANIPLMPTDTVEPAATTPAPPNLLGPDATLALDIPCLKCGYSLRHQPLAGRCPECNAPVAPATRGDLLRFVPPRQLLAIIGGLIVLLLCAPLWAVLPISVNIAVRLRQADETAQTVIAVAVAYRATYLPLLVLTAIGAWLFFRITPNSAIVDEPQSARSAIAILRFAAIATLISLLLSAFSNPDQTTALAWMALVVHGALLSLVGGVFHWACWARLIDLTRRVPVRSTRTIELAGYLPAVIGCMAIAEMVLMLYMAGTGSPPPTPLVESRELLLYAFPFMLCSLLLLGLPAWIVAWLTLPPLLRAWRTARRVHNTA